MTEQSYLNSLYVNRPPFTPTPVLQGIKALLVEDEYDIADLLIFVLQEYGAEVIHTDCAAQALQILDQQQPHILICNIRLPDHDGIWLIQQIRTKRFLNQTIPAIAVTSYMREFNIEEAFESGFQHFLEKPIDPDELVATVLSLLQQA